MRPLLVVQAVAAWIDTKDRVRVAVAARPGRFGTATTLAAGRPGAPATLGEDGRIGSVFADAPFFASVAGGPRRKLTSKLAYQPTVRPLGNGAIAVWQEPGAKWGVAIERRGLRQSPRAGRPGARAAPRRGLPAGVRPRHAVLTWISADGAIRVGELG